MYWMFVIIGIVTLCAGLYLGWYAHKWMVDLERDMESVIEDALKEYEK